MTAAWPADLPQYVEQGSAETFSPDTVESTLANGPSEIRRRIRGKTREFDVQLYCEAEKLEAFEAFYRDTLADGVLPFTGPHPRTRVQGLFKFRGEPPGYHGMGSGQAVIISFKLGQIR